MANSAVPYEHGVKTRLPRDVVEGGADGLTTFLAVFSMGLGLAETLAPGGLARWVGVRTARVLVPAFGVREIVSGLGILASRRPAGWVWSRVAGDVLDAATLGTELNAARGRRRDRLTKALAAVAGVTVLDLIAARRHGRT